MSEDEVHSWLNSDSSPTPAKHWLLAYQAMHPGLRHQFDTARAHPT